jgi:ribonuclease P protein component
MLPRNQRIPKAAAREVFMRGNTFSFPYFLLKILPSDQKESRFAVSVSKKIAPTAVLRNRTRRRVYSVLRNYIIRTKAGFNVAFVAKKGADNLKGEVLVKEIETALVHAKLLVR